MCCKNKSYKYSKKIQHRISGNRVCLILTHYYPTPLRTFDQFFFAVSCKMEVTSKNRLTVVFPLNFFTSFQNYLVFFLFIVRVVIAVVVWWLYVVW